MKDSGRREEEARDRRKAAKEEKKAQGSAEEEKKKQGSAEQPREAAQKHKRCAKRQHEVNVKATQAPNHAPPHICTS